MKVVILSGLPGSGKSTYAKREFAGAIVVSADNYFMKNGVYTFDFTKIALAHQDCWRKFFDAVNRKFAMIVVDNTNLTAAEISPYMLPAETFGYEVEIRTIQIDPDVAKSRNTHGVPAPVIDSMAKNLATRVLPPWWKHTVIDASATHLGVAK